jgi:hypothetical protein
MQKREMMDIKRYKMVSEDITDTIILDGEDLYRHFVDFIKLNIPSGKDPEDVRFYVNVPGGGDWSNMELDINEKSPLIIEIKQKSIREENE